MYDAYGYSTQAFDVFLATDLTPGPPAREVTELDMVQMFVSDDALPDMIRSGDIVDAPSLAALTLWQLDRS